MLRRVQPLHPDRPAFNVANLEHEIAGEIARLPERREDPEPPPVVAHDDDPAELEAKIGRVTAAAVQKGYENAAREFEAMGAELTANLGRIEATKAETVAAIADLQEVTAHYREEGRRIAAAIENHAALTTEARVTAKALKEKIAGAPA